VKVASRIVAVTGFLLALLLAVLVYHVAQVRELAAASERLSTTAFTAAGLALRLERDRWRIEELTRRLWVLRDPDYAAGIARRQEEFAGYLGELEALDLAPEEGAAVTELTRGWRGYLRAWNEVAAAALGGGDRGSAEEAVLARLVALGEQLAVLAGETERQIALLRADVDRERRRAERVSWWTALAALVLSLPIVVLTLRSIQRPLSRLLEGTRAVAEGRFAYRLEAKGKDELSELAGSFNRMVERLGELDRLKSDFLSHVSHELRTPLVAMRETNDALLDELAGPLAAEQRRLLELNQRGGERLTRMLTRLLDLARMEAGAVEYDLRPHDLGTMVRETVEGWGGHAERRSRLDLDLPATPVVVRCDRERFPQVIENLLANAEKYSPAGGPIALRLAREGGAAVLAVEDEGPGVPELEKPRIFEKFHRARGPARPGFGLGLAICREIVIAHGGAIWVEDNEPRGSRFCVRLDLAEAAAA
jgi:two-component system sensor histidine kinase GlrK